MNISKLELIQYISWIVALIALIWGMVIRTSNPSASPFSDPQLRPITGILIFAVITGYTAYLADKNEGFSWPSTLGAIIVTGIVLMVVIVLIRFFQ